MNHGIFIRLGPQDGSRPRRGLSLLLGHDGEEQPGLHHHLQIYHKYHHNHHQLHPHHQRHLHPIDIITDIIIIFFSCLYDDQEQHICLDMMVKQYIKIIR